MNNKRPPAKPPMNVPPPIGCEDKESDKGSTDSWTVELGLVIGVGLIGAVTGFVLEDVRFAVFGGALATVVAAFEWWRRYDNR
jgi:hypothetical protein